MTTGRGGAPSGRGRHLGGDGEMSAVVRYSTQHRLSGLAESVQSYHFADLVDFVAPIWWSNPAVASVPHRRYRLIAG